MAHSRKSPVLIPILLPSALSATTYAAFQLGGLSLGPLMGYLAAFVFYWIFWCLGVSLVILGTSGVVGLLYV
jgi:hypothetical protein